MDEKGKRLAFFFDGFNFYHSLNPDYRKYLWLDYRRLAELFTPPGCTIENILLFTAIAEWKTGSARRHRSYLRVLESLSIEIIQGKFYPKQRRCGKCNTEYPSHEEKQTDVNIAVNILTMAFENKYDEIVLASADSDIVPALKSLRKLFPYKHITVLFPFKRSSYELSQVADVTFKVKEKHLASSQLPDRYRFPDGREYHRPEGWR